MVENCKTILNYVKSKSLENLTLFLTQNISTCSIAPPPPGDVTSILNSMLYATPWAWTTLEEEHSYLGASAKTSLGVCLAELKH
jgi:hypothetical protein